MPILANGIFMAQSLFLIGSGCYMLLSPEQAAQRPQLEGAPPGVILSFGLSTLSLGSCYAYLAYKGDRDWMKFSAAGRALAATVFFRTGGAMQEVAYFETIIGLLTGLALWSGR